MLKETISSMQSRREKTGSGLIQSELHGDHEPRANRRMSCMRCSDSSGAIRHAHESIRVAMGFERPVASPEIGCELTVNE